jgi:hypothetical protein
VRGKNEGSDVDEVSSLSCQIEVVSDQVTSLLTSIETSTFKLEFNLESNDDKARLETFGTPRLLDSDVIVNGLSILDL